VMVLMVIPVLEEQQQKLPMMDNEDLRSVWGLIIRIFSLSNVLKFSMINNDADT
jgi:hypothetical protein